jgi:hypothetical protein
MINEKYGFPSEVVPSALTTVMAELLMLFITTLIGVMSKFWLMLEVLTSR